MAEEPEGALGMKLPETFWSSQNSCKYHVLINYATGTPWNSKNSWYLCGKSSWMPSTSDHSQALWSAGWGVSESNMNRSYVHLCSPADNEPFDKMAQLLRGSESLELLVRKEGKKYAIPILSWTTQGGTGSFSKNRWRLVIMRPYSKMNTSALPWNTGHSWLGHGYQPSYHVSHRLQ